jgi:hypothetical protein
VNGAYKNQRLKNHSVKMSIIVITMMEGGLLQGRFKYLLNLKITSMPNSLRVNFSEQHLTKIKTKTAEVYWLEEKILRMNIIDSADLDIAESINNINAIDLITRNRPFYLLVDARAFWNTSKEAREYTDREEAKREILAKAIIVKSISSRLFAHFSIKFNHGQSISKMFNSETKAIGWLRGLKN